MILSVKLQSQDYFGPEQPPAACSAVHHEWLGSAPDKWMDRSSGKVRGVRQIPTALRNGIDGPARQGLGGYARDVPKRLCEERQETRSFSTPAHAARLGGLELQWRPSRRSVEPPHVAMRAAGCLEPELITKRPQFVPRHGQTVLRVEAEGLPPHYCEGSKRVSDCAVKALRRRQAAERKRERRHELRQVRDLEAWEAEHLGGAGAAGAADDGQMPLTGLGNSASAPSLLAGLETTQRPSAAKWRQMPRWLGDSRLQFTRPMVQ